MTSYNSTKIDLTQFHRHFYCHSLFTCRYFGSGGGSKFLDVCRNTDFIYILLLSQFTETDVEFCSSVQKLVCQLIPLVKSNRFEVASTSSMMLNEKLELLLLGPAEAHTETELTKKVNQWTIAILLNQVVIKGT